MVHPGHHIREVDHNGIIVMGPRKAYVSFAFQSIPFFDDLGSHGLVAGSGKTVLWYVSRKSMDFLRVHVNN
jgi:hypothetical protein